MCAAMSATDWEFAFVGVFMKYKKISIKIMAFICALVIGFCSPVGEVCSMQVQAAAITAPLTWNLWQTIFGSLGFGLSLNDSSNSDGDVAAIEEGVLDYLVNTKGMSTTEAESYINDIRSNISLGSIIDNTLAIPKNIWNTLKDFCKDKLMVEPEYLPSDSLVVSDAAALCNHFQSLFSSLIGKDVLSNYALLPLFEKVAGAPFKFFIAENAYWYIFYAKPVNSTFEYVTEGNYLYLYIDGSKSGYFQMAYNKSGKYVQSLSTNDLNWYDFNTNSLIPNPCLYSTFVAGGSFYNVDSYVDAGVLKFPVSAFSAPSDVISSNIVNKTVFGNTDIKELYKSGSFDILTNGQAYDADKKEVVGDVVLNIPSVDVLDGLNSGTVTWEDFMDKVGAQPVDTVAGTNAFTDEFISIQAETNSIVSGISTTVSNILDAILSLPSTIAKAIAGLFIPSEGFIEGKLDMMIHEIGSLGVSPFDMQGLFYESSNPFDDIVVNIRGQDVVIVSFEYLPDFIDHFRPVIRGLMALFMLYYCVNQLLGILRISGMIQGDNSSRDTGGKGV